MIIVMNTTDEHRREQRHRHAPEDLPLVRAVGPRRLQHLARDRRQPGGDHHHREARPDPDVGDHDRRGDQVRAEPGHARRTAPRTSPRDRDAVARRPRRPRTRSAVGVASWSRRRARRRRRAARPSRRAGRLALLEHARLAAAGLEVAPHRAGDRARRAARRLRAPAARRSGSSSGGIAVSPSSADVARLRPARCSTKPSLGLPLSSSASRRWRVAERARRLEGVVDHLDRRR